MKPNLKTVLFLNNSIVKSVRDFFEKLEYKIISKRELPFSGRIDFVVVLREEDIFEMKKLYQLETGEAEYICLGMVNSIKDFLADNGRLSVQEDMFENMMGQSLVNKFLNKSVSIHLQDNFPAIENLRRFSITNHLSYGASSDRISLDAFDHGFNIVSLKSFIDHTVNYLTYLRQGGLAGIPYEFEYGFDGNFFVLNIHANVKNFVAEYMIDSFGAINSDDPLKFLLGVIVKCCDFLDITHVEDPGKIVFTSIWSKNETEKLSGFSFSNIKTVEQSIQAVEKVITSYNQKQIEAKAVELEEKPLPGSLTELVGSAEDGIDISSYSKELMAFVVRVYSEEKGEDVLSSINDEEFKQLVKDFPDKEKLERVSSAERKRIFERIQKSNFASAYNKEIDRTKNKLKSKEEFKKIAKDKFEKEVIEKVSGFVNSESINRVMGKGGDSGNDMINVVSGQETLGDEFSRVMSNGGEDTTERVVHKLKQGFQKREKELGNVNKKYKSEILKILVKETIDEVENQGLEESVLLYVKKSAPTEIINSVEGFVADKGQKLDELSSSELAEYRENELPRIIRKILNDPALQDNFLKELREKDKEKQNIAENLNRKLKEKIKENELLKVKALSNHKFTTEDVKSSIFQNVIQETISESIKEEFNVNEITPEGIKEKEKEIVQVISESLNIEKENVQQIVSQAKKVTEKEEKAIIIKELQNSRPDESKVGSESRDKASGMGSFAEVALLEKLQKTEKENDDLKLRIKALQIKVASTGVVNEKLKDISEQSKLNEQELESLKRAAGTSVVGGPEKRVQLIEGLKSGKALSEKQAQSITNALEREEVILREIDVLEEEARRVTLINEKREVIYKAEIEKLTRGLKAKELVVDKVKDAAKSLNEKKNIEVKKLTDNVRNLTDKLQNDDSANLAATAQALARDKVSAEKMLAVYRGKIETMAKAVAKSKKSDNSKQLSHEVRELKKEKAKLENKALVAGKQAKANEFKLNEFKYEEKRSKAKSLELEKSLKDMKKELLKAKEEASKVPEKIEEASGPSPAKLKTDLDKARAQARDLQNKLEESIKKIKSIEEVGTKTKGKSPAASANAQRLERSVKKLNAELVKIKADGTEKKKELVKIKNELNTLKNENVGLKREVERSKARQKKKVA